MTLSDTPIGDFFDDEGNPLTQEEAAERHRRLHETDIMPDSISDVIDEIGSDEDDDPDDPTTGTGLGDDPDLVGEKIPRTNPTRRRSSAPTASRLRTTRRPTTRPPTAPTTPVPKKPATTALTTTTTPREAAR